MDVENEKNVVSGLEVNALRGNLSNPTWSMLRERDNEGRLWVACSECNKGGSGSDEGQCASGGKIKKFNGKGCFLGVLLEGLNFINVTLNFSI